MKARTNIERRIDKERQKITELQIQVERAEAFIQGLQEALKILPKDDNGKPRKGRGTLRPGSDMAKIRDLMVQAGKPMHVTQIVISLGRENNKANRLSITGSLGRYVRRGEIFRRVGANLFTLIDTNNSKEIDLPSDFGMEANDDNLANKDTLF